MRNIFLLIIVILSLGTSLKSQEIVLFGNIPDYAGEELIFSRYTEFITNELVDIEKCTVDSNGNFRVSIKSDEIIEIHLIKGIYDGLLIGEPGREYNIMLPSYEEKSFKELCNPFFEEIGYYIGYTDTIDNDINVKMQDIVREFDFFLSENYTKILYGKPPRHEVDSFIDVINKSFPSTGNSFLEKSISYKTGFLQFISRYYTPEEIASEYFLNSAILYNNKSYMNLFNNVFESFFKAFPANTEGDSYGTIIVNGKGITPLMETVKTSLNIENQDFAELLILKGLFDGFHNGDYLARDVLPILDSISVISKNEINIKIANNISQSVLHMLPGSTAPDFELYNNKFELVKLSDFRGKYVYLNFVSHQSGASRRELSLIPELKKEFRKKIVFVTVSVDESFSEFLEMSLKNKYDWELLSVKNQPDVLKAYKVKSFPTCFLIDPYGKLILVPARLPSEAFDNQFYRILNSIR